MPVTPTYPGLYIEELPSSAHTITAAPTSITVFVGYVSPFKTPAANVGVPVELFSFSDFEREFGGAYESSLIDSNLASAVYQFFLNGGADAYVVGLLPTRYTDDRGDGSKKFGDTLNFGPAVAPSTIKIPNASTPALIFTALEPVDSVPMTVTISNPRTVTVTVTDPKTKAVTTPSVQAADIVVSYGSLSETYRKVNLVANNPDFIETRIGVPGTLVSSLVTIGPPQGGYPSSYPFPMSPPTNTPPVLQAATDLDRDLPKVGSPASPATGVFNATDFAPVFATDGALDKLPIFNLMAIPGIVNFAVLSEALAFCERKHAFLVMDPPIIDVADGGDAKNNYVGRFIDQTGDSNGNIAPLSENGALYFPFLKSFDPLGNQQQLPPSGFVTGVYARTDQNRGVWKAPAGLETIVSNTTGVIDSGRMTDPRHGDLNGKGANCLRTFSTGTVVFGARTLVGATDNTTFEQWRYVPVRRMALFIEQTLLRNLKWVIFEPNDQPLWTAITNSINAFMLSLFTQGAFQGSKPSEAFQVKCDSTTTTQTDIGNGVVNIVVAFAPLKPAEFVIIKIAQLAGQAQQ